MDIFDRIHELHRTQRQAPVPIPRAALQERLECSRGTVGRIIGDAVDESHAPWSPSRTRGA